MLTELKHPKKLGIAACQKGITQAVNDLIDHAKCKSASSGDDVLKRWPLLLGDTSLPINLDLLVLIFE